MQIKFQTDVGLKRNTNQDFIGLFQNKKGVFLAVLADGMGGHLAGDVASQMAVNHLGEAWQTTTLLETEEMTTWLQNAIEEENEKIYQKGQSESNYAGMGTTIVAAAIVAHAFVLANIGDSRAYLIADQTITQLTEDHSLVNELVKSGEITRQAAANHPRKNVLTRSLGMPTQVHADIETHSFATGNSLLLCSDGLTNMVSDEEILEIVTTDASLSEKIQQLIVAANAAGGADNISVMLILFDEKEENQ